MKTSKKRSIKETAKTPKNKKLKTHDENKMNEQKKEVAQQKDKEDDNDFQRVFMDNFYSSGFYNHSF